MMAHAARWWLNLTLSGVLILLCVAFYGVGIRSLSQTQFFEVSGWTLFALLLVLTLFTVRKKFPFLPLMTAARWLHFHLYAGLLSIALFLTHIRMSIPTGILEITLTGLFIAVTASGLLGWGLSRILPKRLTIRGEQVIYERIPQLRRQLGEEAETVITRGMDETGTATIPEFYARRLVGYFAGPRNFWWHVIESTRPRFRLLGELAALDRYLNDSERQQVRQLTDLIRAKDDLDYQYTHQTILKYWLFIHIPLTYSLLMVGLAHGLLMVAYYAAFRGDGG